MSDPTFTEAEATAFATRYGLNLPADQMATLAGKMAEIAKAGLAIPRPSTKFVMPAPVFRVNNG
jgi:aspartate/methionine/tyrosine aminotransferase